MFVLKAKEKVVFVLFDYWKVYIASFQPHKFIENVTLCTLQKNRFDQHWSQ